jgi:hypothetical protein
MELNLSSYTVKDIKQLQEMIKKTLDHYLKIQEDSQYLSTLFECDRLAFRLCLKQAEDDMKEIDDELEKRSAFANAISDSKAISDK